MLHATERTTAMAETISTFATRVVSGVIAGAIRSWLSGGPTGSSRVRLSGFPLAIDVFVGDIVRVDFESRFEFVNESWQAAHELIGSWSVADECMHFDLL